MVTVAERKAAGVIPLPRTRFNAMIMTGIPARRAMIVSRMRVIGAREIAEASTAAEARQASANPPQSQDFCIIDGTSADEPVLPLLGHLRQAGWRRIMLLSGRSDAPAVRAAMMHGARSFLVVRPEEVSKAEPVRARPRSGSPDELSSREVEVLQLVAEGQSNKDIGEALSLSALTVKSHLARIARKLGTGDRAEMVALAVRANLIH